jgi:tRNA1Val (adenine37-N6)-methyltransferase
VPNNYFQFKDFIVQQEKCSMKVCTDSCLFGAWVAHKIKKDNSNAKSILDIGTGTGLLALMLAQKTIGSIDSVDIDKNAVAQASENFNSSAWKDRMKVFHADINEWQPPAKYDLIISNPPFYENDLIPANTGKAIAKHSSTLQLKDLLSKAKSLLDEEGRIALLLPSHRSEWLENKALAYSFFVREKIEVRQTPLHNYFRTMLLLQCEKTETLKSELTIKNNNNQYTSEFRELLKDYYLNL